VEIGSLLEGVPQPRRLLVTNHDALQYFADRYGFEVIGVVVPGGSTMAQPSSAALSELIDQIGALGVPAIFGETTEASALLDAIAAEPGLDVVVVDLFIGSLGGPGSGAATYVDMMRLDAQLIAEALG
jgi:zinc/manganese transport system substrate-binding protein